MMQPAAPGRPSNSLHFIVGEMSGKLDQVLTALLDDRERVRKGFAEHDRRLTVLEGWRWKLVGGGSLIVLVLGSTEAWRFISGR